MPLVAEPVRPVVALVIAACVFGVVERLGRLDRLGAPWKRAGFWTDVGWWMLTPFVTRSITRIGTGVAVFFIAWATLGHPLDKPGLRAFLDRETWASALPLPIEILITLTAADFLGYWTHRAFHRGWLWRSHAVHHSSERLDWLAAVRVHPLNDLLGGVVRVAVLVALGFRPTVLAAVVPFLTAYAVLLHANVTWAFGPVGRVIASPMFHRWHHARDVEGADVNFGGFFTVWDCLFGTSHLPIGEAAPATGIRDRMPASIWGQLAIPFRRESRSKRARLPPSPPSRHAEATMTCPCERWKGRHGSFIPVFPDDVFETVERYDWPLDLHGAIPHDGRVRCRACGLMYRYQNNLTGAVFEVEAGEG